MDVIEFYEDMCKEPEDVLDKLERVTIINTASEELELSSMLYPETEKELISIGIEPEEFIRRFQETTS